MDREVRWFSSGFDPALRVEKPAAGGANDRGGAVRHAIASPVPAPAAAVGPRAPITKRFASGKNHVMSNWVSVRRVSVGELGGRRRAKTAPLPRLESSAFDGPQTLETRALPRLFFLAFVALLVIQVLLAL
jgi:hypothetical protein